MLAHLALGFLNPALLWALPLAALPIIIHLLNKRRFQKVKWAAMEFLLQAMKRNRRRLRMEHFILLLLRTLAVLFLVFLVTRPQLTGGALLGVRTHHVVLLDDSASMAQRSGARHVYENARDRVRQFADRFVRTRSGDLFSLVRSSDPGQPDLFAERIGPRLGEQLGKALGAHGVGDATLDLAEMIAVVRDKATDVEEAGRTEYHLFTDNRQHDWLRDDGSARPDVLEQLRAMDPESEHFTLQPLGAASRANLAVVGIDRKARIAVAGVPLGFTVEVANQGLDPSSPAEVAFEVDGRSRVVRPVEGLVPGESVTLEFEHTFHTPGFHGIEASLPTDRYPVDDHRSLALEVRDRSRALLVDGDPGDDPRESETFYLAAALQPGGDSVSGIEVQIVEDSDLADTELADYDMIWLCNVPVPDEGVVERLEAFAAAGGGLAFFAGNQIDPDRYDRILYRDGEGLLPARVLDIDGDPDRPERLVLADKTHPIVQVSPDLIEKILGVTSIVGRYMPLEPDPRRPSRTVLRLEDVEGAPLMVIGPYGDGGRVTLVGVTADVHWSNLPTTFAFQPLCVELHEHSVRVQDLSAFNLGTRGVFTWDLDQGLYQSDVALRSRADAGEVRTFTAVRPPRDEGAAQEGPAPGDAGQMARLTVPMRRLSALGLYDVVVSSHGGATETVILSRNPPVVEGRLARMSRSLLWDAYPTSLKDRFTVLAEGDGSSGREGEGELWRILAAALLAGLLLESFLAWRFGRR